MEKLCSKICENVLSRWLTMMKLFSLVKAAADNILNVNFTHRRLYLFLAEKLGGREQET
jgi:hypothetical protein